MLHIEILLKESLDDRWSEWFDGLATSAPDCRQTRLSGTLRDQTALHGVLERIRDLNLQIISVDVIEIHAQKFDQTYPEIGDLP